LATQDPHFIADPFTINNTRKRQAHCTDAACYNLQSLRLRFIFLYQLTSCFMLYHIHTSLCDINERYCKALQPKAP